jgi:hypothetical protein
MSAGPERYVLDANAFIQAKRRFYGFDFCPGYWRALIWHCQQGRLCSIDKIRDELMRGGDDLAQWVEQELMPNAFAGTSTPDVATVYAEMLGWVMAQPHYLPTARTEFQQVADGWLAAYAKAHRCIVVTLEEYDPLRRNRVPLVNVWRAFDVVTISPFEMLRRIDVQLKWQPPS